MFFILAILAYLMGALPLGYWAIHRLTGKDPRLASAYNLGLENTFKRLGTGPALLAWGLDCLKGLLTVWLGGQWGLSWAVVFALLVYWDTFTLPGFSPRARCCGGGGLGCSWALS